MHTADRAAVFSRGLLNAWGQLLRDVGADRENEVLILTGTGRQWIAGFDPGSFAQAMSTWHSDVLYEHYIDGIKLLERLAFDIDIPTIAAINGPGPRQELALMCDLRLCAEDTVIADGNFVAGSVPGDGMHLVLQELLGPKRAAQMVYTGEQIDAATALRLGLVNEVLPPDQVMTRAREIAAAIMAKPRTARRLTHAVINDPGNSGSSRTCAAGTLTNSLPAAAKHRARTRIGQRVRLSSFETARSPGATLRWANAQPARVRFWG
jgi:enoyl-CoA hydratase/carnithine racemase